MVSQQNKTKIMVIIVMIILLIPLSYFSYTLLIPSKVTLPPGTDITVDDDGSADYSTIQDAINAAKDGDTIFVYSGAYKENVVIDRRINLVGEDKWNTIIDGRGEGDVVYVKISGVSIKDFTIQNSGDVSWPDEDAGIEIYSLASNTTVSDCRIINCRVGVNLGGRSSSNNRFLNCILSGHYNGFYVDTSSNNEITKCVISNNRNAGIVLSFSSNWNISECVFSDNKNKGVQLCYSSDYNEITKCIFSNNGYGIIIGYSGNVFETSCEENKVYRNNFLSNENQAYDKWSNEWYNNCWSDYAGDDENNDGVGDTPYIVPGGDNKDDHPFMKELDLVLPEEGKPVEKFVVQPVVLLILVVIIIVSIVAGGITYRKKKKEKEKRPEKHVSEEAKPMPVKCPYCNTTFNITPTKKPFKIRCPSCNKKSMLR